MAPRWWQTATSLSVGNRELGLAWSPGDLAHRPDSRRLCVVKQDAYRRSPPGRKLSSWHSPPSLLFSTISFTAALCLALGLYLLWLQVRGTGRGYRASAGVVLLLLSACQGKMAMCLFQRASERATGAAPRVWTFAGRMLVGVAVCYAITLGVEIARLRPATYSLPAWHPGTPALLVPAIFPRSFAGLVAWPGITQTLVAPHRVGGGYRRGIDSSPGRNRPATVGLV